MSETPEEPLTFEEALRAKKRARQEDLDALADGRKTAEQIRAQNDIFAEMPKLRIRFDEAEPLR